MVAVVVGTPCSSATTTLLSAAAFKAEHVFEGIEREAVSMAVVFLFVLEALLIIIVLVVVVVVVDIIRGLHKTVSQQRNGIQ